MPCRSDYPDSDCTTSKLKAELDKVTRLLCEVCSQDPSGFLMSKELKAWWEKHQEFDMGRKKSELEHTLRVLDTKISHIKTLGGLPGKKLLDDRRQVTQGLDALKVRG